jgi:hypothetical protein
MEYVLAVFSLRTDTIQFNYFLNKNRIKSSVVETPKSASASCGISVKFPAEDLPIVRRLMPLSGARSFVRFYLVQGMYGRYNLTPLR